MIENEIKYILDETNPKIMEQVASIGAKKSVVQGYIPGKIGITKNSNECVFYFSNGILGFEKIIDEKYCYQLLEGIWNTPTIRSGELLTTQSCGRIRKAEYDNQIDYIFTFKKDVGNGRLIEIEDSITETKFNILWKNATQSVYKTRYKHCDPYGIHWDIDFLLTNDQKNYLALAEAEMPEHMDEPFYLPNVVKENIIHKVSRTDKRFTNKKLSDIQYAKNLLSKIRNKSINTELN